jgi:hypothetical protein
MVNTKKLTVKLVMIYTHHFDIEEESWTPVRLPQDWKKTSPLSSVISVGGSQESFSSAGREQGGPLSCHVVDHRFR